MTDRPVVVDVQEAVTQQLLRLGHSSEEEVAMWIACHRGLVNSRALKRVESVIPLPSKNAAALVRELLSAKVPRDRDFALLVNKITDQSITEKSQLTRAMRYLAGIPETDLVDDAAFTQAYALLNINDEELRAMVDAALDSGKSSGQSFAGIEAEKLVWVVKRADERLRHVTGARILAAIAAHQAAVGVADHAPHVSLRKLVPQPPSKHPGSVPYPRNEEVHPSSSEHPPPPASKKATPVDMLELAKHDDQLVWVVGDLGRFKASIGDDCLVAELWGTNNSCLVQFPRSETQKRLAHMEHHHVAAHGRLRWNPLQQSGRPILVADRWVTKQSVTPNVSFHGRPYVTSNPPANVWTWERFNESPLAPPTFLRHSMPLLGFNKEAVLIINTGGTLSCVQDPKTGLLSPKPLFDHLVTFPGFGGNIVREQERIASPHAGFVVLEDADRLMLDSTCMNAANSWNLISMIIETRTTPAACYKAIVVIHGTDTLAFTASAATFALRGLRIPVVLTGSQMPLRPVVHRPVEREESTGSDFDIDDIDIEVPPTLEVQPSLLGDAANPLVSGGDALASAQYASSGHFTPRVRSAQAALLATGRSGAYGDVPSNSSQHRNDSGPGVSDALENLTRALVYAASPKAVREVVVFFNNKVMLGTRVVKVHASHFDAFHSPNFSILAFFDGQLRISRHVSELIAKSSSLERLRLDSSLQLGQTPPCSYHWNARVVLWETSPATLPQDAAFNLRALIAAHGGFDAEMSVPIGVVFRGYGAGNAQPELCNLLRFIRKELCIPVIWCSQCFAGAAEGAYSVGLGRVHGVNVADMTKECAYVRMLHAISQFAGVYGARFKRSKRFLEIVEDCLQSPYRLCFSPTDDSDEGKDLADYIRDSTIARYQ